MTVLYLTKTFAVKTSYTAVICYMKAHQRNSALSIKAFMTHTSTTTTTDSASHTTEPQFNTMTHSLTSITCTPLPHSVVHTHTHTHTHTHVRARIHTTTTTLQVARRTNVLCTLVCKMGQLATNCSLHKETNPGWLLHPAPTSA